MKRIVAACALFCLAVSGRAQTEYPFPVFQTDGLSLYTLNGEDISGADMHVTSTPELIVEMPTTMDEATVLDLTTPRLVWADTGGRLNDTAGAVWDATNAGVAVGAVGASSQFDWGFGAFTFSADTAAISRAEGAAAASEKPFAVVHYGGTGLNDGFYYAHADGTFASPSDLSIGGVDTILSYYGYKTGAFRRMPVIDVEPTSISTLGVVADVKINSFLGGWVVGGDGGLRSGSATPYLDATINGPIATVLGQWAFGDADSYHAFYTGGTAIGSHGEGTLALANDLGVVQVTINGNTGDIATTGNLDVDADANVDGGLVVDGDVDFGGGDLAVDSSTGYTTTGSRLTVGEHLAVVGRIGVGPDGAGAIGSYGVNVKMADARMTVQSTSSSGLAAIQAFEEDTENIFFGVYGDAIAGNILGASGASPAVPRNGSGAGNVELSGYVGTAMVVGTVNAASLYLSAGSIARVEVEGDGDVKFYTPRKLTSETVTIASGALTVATGWLVAAAESGTADDLATINGGEDGELLTITPDAGDTITLVETGNVVVVGAASAAMTGYDRAECLYALSKWTCEFLDD